MSDPSAAGAEPSDEAADLYAEFLERRESDPSQEFEALCREHPRLASELRAMNEVRSWLEGTFQRSSEQALAERLRQKLEQHGEPERELPDPLAHLRERRGAHARYDYEGEVGRGGMGAILRLWDQDLRRSVAMKVALPRRDVDGSERVPVRNLSRFLQEAQITAQLDHPGVVPVHDVGIDEQGRAYFTMRLVRGRSVAEIFELARRGAEGWTLGRAVGVLVRVCETLAFAHSRGVVHRDLKPENVMVGDFGETYVMDWGLALVLDSEGRAVDPTAEAGAPPTQDDARIETQRVEERRTPSSPLVTQHGAVVGTPSFFSPEQAESRLRDVGPASDVYAVGAMLYSLLTGTVPYVARGEHPSFGEVLERTRAGPPEPVERLAPGAPAELVAVCEKAMAREPGQRYGDSMQMAGDLRAFLEDRVVRAYETGALAEFRKWVRRNRSFAGAAAAGIAVLVLGSSAFAWQQRQSARSERELNGQLTLARDEALDAQSAAERAQLEAEEAQLDAEQAGELAHRRLTDVRDLARAMVFDLQEEVVHLRGGTDLRKRLVELGLRYIEGLSAEAGSDPDLLRDLAGAYERIGALQGHPSRVSLGARGPAVASLGRAVELYDDLLEGSPDDPVLLRGWINSMTLLAALRAESELGGEVEAQFDRAWQRAERLLALEALQLEDLLEIAELAGERGRALLGRGDWHSAQPWLDRCLELADRMSAMQPGAGRGPMMTGHYYTAVVRVMSGRPEEALESLEVVEEVCGELIAENPDDVLARNILSNCFSTRGTVLSQMGRVEEALVAAEAFVEALQERTAGDPLDDKGRRDLISAWLHLGEYRVHLRRPDATEPLLLGLPEAQALFQQEPQNPWVVDILASYYNALARHELNEDGDLDRGLDHAHQAVDLYRRVVDAQPGNGNARRSLDVGTLNIGALYQWRAQKRERPREERRSDLEAAASAYLDWQEIYAGRAPGAEFGSPDEDTARWIAEQLEQVASDLERLENEP